MYDKTEDFGSMVVRSADWKSTKKIELYFNKRLSGEQMVRQAIRIAKRYNAVITKPLEYIPDSSIGGRIMFEVRCHNLTYRYFYDGGNLMHCTDKEVTEKDIAKYEEQFGTKKCIDKNFKKKYWYHDNWVGTRREFKTLKAAKEAAKKETGVSITIYTNFPYGRTSKIACFAEASGFIPP